MALSVTPHGQLTACRRRNSVRSVAALVQLLCLSHTRFPKPQEEKKPETLVVALPETPKKQAAEC